MGLNCRSYLRIAFATPREELELYKFVDVSNLIIKSLSPNFSIFIAYHKVSQDELRQRSFNVST